MNQRLGAGQGSSVDSGLSPSHHLAGAEPLTPREVEVIELVAEGLKNAEIAHRLGISVSTARGHLREVNRKLGALSRTEAAVTWVVRTLHHSG